ncbi:hypothetical protein EYF80_031423 [Liparis tanakae]|uniref:Uncharacterized protein n=1 Tax=Liparis tanakae TaxID=230148 RepID=A0A4Z2GYM5_9TELE|nr:hypothetical protein EYF80_031423 [Liparis tanakae]
MTVQFGFTGAELPQSWMAISVKKTNRDEKKGEDVVTRADGGGSSSGQLDSERLASKARTKSTASFHNLLRQPIWLTLQRGGASLAFEMDSIAPPPLPPCG